MALLLENAILRMLRVRLERVIQVLPTLKSQGDEELLGQKCDLPSKSVCAKLLLQAALPLALLHVPGIQSPEQGVEATRRNWRKQTGKQVDQARVRNPRKAQYRDRLVVGPPGRWRHTDVFSYSTLVILWNGGDHDFCSQHSDGLLEQIKQEIRFVFCSQLCEDRLHCTRMVLSPLSCTPTSSFHWLGSCFLSFKYLVFRQSKKLKHFNFRDSDSQFQSFPNFQS